jgi:HSP20 family protein
MTALTWVSQHIIVNKLLEREGTLMSSMLPSDNNNDKKTKSEPFGELMKSMNDFFKEKPVKGFLRSIDDFFKSPFPSGSSLHVDTIETGGEYIISAELPGVKKEQIHLNFTENYLTISIENNEGETEEDEHNGVFRSKSIRQQSSRTISFPQTINEKKVKASYRDGLLKIRVPQEKGKVIEIED